MSLFDFNPHYAFNRRFFQGKMKSYLMNQKEEMKSLTEREKSKEVVEYLDEKFQKIAERNPEYLSERLTSQEDTIRKINLSIDEEIRKDAGFIPQ